MYNACEQALGARAVSDGTLEDFRRDQVIFASEEERVFIGSIGGNPASCAAGDPRDWKFPARPSAPLPFPVL